MILSLDKHAKSNNKNDILFDQTPSSSFNQYTGRKICVRVMASLLFSLSMSFVINNVYIIGPIALHAMPIARIRATIVQFVQSTTHSRDIFLTLLFGSFLTSTSSFFSYRQQTIPINEIIERRSNLPDVFFVLRLTSMSGKKSTGLAYFFALTGGLFGFHHLYLGRTQHALLWFTTFGGFGIGLLYEFIFSLRNYVREVNNDDYIIARYEKKFREQKSPAFELVRFCGQYVIAIFYGLITYYAFPEAWLQKTLPGLLIGLCSCLAVAFGTQLVGTLGPRQCSFTWPLFGAFLGLPFLIWQRDGSPSFNIAAFLSCWVFEWKIDWDPDYFSSESSASSKKTKRQRRHIVKRCLILGCGAIVFGMLLTSTLYQNLQVDINGERVKVKDVIADFFKSQEFILLYQQLSNVMKQLYAFYLQFGLKGIWTQIWAALDSESDKKAFEVLNLKPDASQKAIEAQCRTLARKWHPDRYRIPEEKEAAEVTFMNIQQACNRLSNERKRRQQINTQKRENPI